MAGNLFTPIYNIQPPEYRAAIRASYRTRGYTHFPIDLFTDNGRSYHDLFPQGPKYDLNTLLWELYNDGLIPVCFILEDHEHTVNVNVDPALVRIAVVKWEMNDPDGGDTDLINRDIMAVRHAFPHALLYVHFTSGHGAGGSPEADWWQWAVNADDGPHVQGNLYQNDPYQTPEDCINRVDDFLIRMGSGYHGWPIADVVLYETQTYTAFWDGKSEADCNAWNDRVLDACMVNAVVYVESGVTYTGRLIGYCNGASPAMRAKLPPPRGK